MNSIYRDHRLLQARTRASARCAAEYRTLLEDMHAKLDRTLSDALQKTRLAQETRVRLDRWINGTCLVLLAGFCLIFMIVLALDVHSKIVSP